MAVFGPNKIEDISGLANEFSKLNITSANSLSKSKSLFINRKNEFQQAVSEKNPPLSKLNDLHGYVLLFCVELLRKARQDKIGQDTLIFVSQIGFILDRLKHNEVDSNVSDINEFTTNLMHSSWFKENISSNYEQNSENDLIPWISKDSELVAALNFLQTTNLESYLSSLLRKIAVDSDIFNLSYLTSKNLNPRYLSYLNSTFLPSLYLSIDITELYQFDIYLKLVPVYLSAAIECKGPAKRYMVNLNQLLVNNIDHSNIQKIFSVLQLNYEIILRGDFAELKGQDSIVKRLLSFDLDTNHIQMLWEYSHSIFNNLNPSTLESLDKFFESKSLILEGQESSWSPMVIESIESPSKDIQNPNADSRRLLPHFQMLQEQAVLRECKDLKERRVIPGQFSQIRFGAAILCAQILHEMGTSDPSRDSMMDYALVSQVLKASNNASSDEELKYALQLLKGAYRQWGGFQRYKMAEFKHMSPVNILGIALLNKKVPRKLSFLKSTNLSAYGKSVIVPNLLNSSHIRLSLKEIDESSGWYGPLPASFHAHLTDDFLPRLFCVVPDQFFEPFDELVSTFIKITLDYPANLKDRNYSSFLKKIKDYISVNFLKISIDNLINILKLCELLEIKFNEHLLISEQKNSCLDLLLKNPQAQWGINGNLIRFKWTIFNDIPRNRFDIVNSEIQRYCKSSEENAKKNSVNRPHEIELMSSILSEVSDEDKCCFYHDYICPETGREIDVAYINEKTKLAIHIDGVNSHYFKDRYERDFRTITHRKALKNAGWVNTYLNLPPTHEPLEPEKEKIFARNVIQLIMELKKMKSEEQRTTPDIDLGPDLFFRPAYFIRSSDFRNLDDANVFPSSILSSRQKELDIANALQEAEIRRAERERLKDEDRKRRIVEQERLKAEKEQKKIANLKKQEQQKKDAQERKLSAHKIEKRKENSTQIDSNKKKGGKSQTHLVQFSTTKTKNKKSKTKSSTHKEKRSNRKNLKIG